jgi:flagellar assembly protein FliH
MPTVLRAADRSLGLAGIAFNFDDVTAQARQYLDEVRAEAGKIIAQAQRDAVAIRKRAEQEGRQAAAQAAVKAAEQAMEKQLTTLLPALRQAIADIHQAKQAWLAHWEATGVHVAAAIARRVMRHELTRQPEVPLKLVREALELAAGSPQIRIHLNPTDHDTLKQKVLLLVHETAGLGEAEIVSDPAITPGGCRVETRFGIIDQQFEAQLERIEEELGP